MGQKFRTLVAAAMALLLAACTGAERIAPLANKPEEAYRLDSGDTIRLIVLESQPMSGEYTVSDAGTVSLPLVGPIPARGQTVPDLERAIFARLQKDYFEKPNVSVEVKSFRPFFILGSVARPGQYPYQPGMTVLTAVAVAGGFTVRARTDEVSIVRTVDGKSEEGVAQRSTQVRPGDVIYVFDRVF
ncbi:polysaccharide export protein [Aerophototrophica crusticola]|uniref:Polysaccharide export protein n=1 Tax=Aerophototrophica crusticola TaxID=1709002 RepID=A0A858R4B7_9PROT|nr:polysaccharide export protein [Rhodospirillaceae bacterium B3]